jgi:hypothetical protein
VSNEKAMEVYLNDHLAGAMLGSDLAEQIRDQNEGTPLGEEFASIAFEIEEDRQILVNLMETMDAQPNPIKKATGWMAEKATRLKFTGASSGEADHGLFMALETLRLGVAGKKCLWIALQEVRDDHEALATLNLDQLLERATQQESRLEAERLKMARRALAKQA